MQNKKMKIENISKQETGNTRGNTRNSRGTSLQHQQQTDKNYMGNQGSNTQTHWGTGGEDRRDNEEKTQRRKHEGNNPDRQRETNMQGRQKTEGRTQRKKHRGEHWRDTKQGQKWQNIRHKTQHKDIGSWPWQCLANKIAFILTDHIFYDS